MQQRIYDNMGGCNLANFPNINKDNKVLVVAGGMLSELHHTDVMLDLMKRINEYLHCLLWYHIKKLLESRGESLSDLETNANLNLALNPWGAGLSTLYRWSHLGFVFFHLPGILFSNSPLMQTAKYAMRLLCHIKCKFRTVDDVWTKLPAQIKSPMDNTIKIVINKFHYSLEHGLKLNSASDVANIIKLFKAKTEIETKALVVVVKEDERSWR